MKKILLILLCIFIVPIHTFALTSREEVKETIDKIENTVVGENVKIVKATMQDSTIDLEIQTDEIRVVSIPFQWEENKLLFGTGKVSIYGENPPTILIDHNDESFYLYSILENLSNSPYDVENYYDDLNIKQKISTSLEKNIPLRYTDISETFGLVLNDELNGTYSLWYTYNLESNFTIVKEKQEETPNPVSRVTPRGLLIMMTLMLVVVLALAFYSFVDGQKRRIRNEKDKKNRG